MKPRCPVCRGNLALGEEFDGRRRLHCLMCGRDHEFPSDRELRLREELRALPREQLKRGRPEGSRSGLSIAQRARDMASAEPRMSQAEIARHLGTSAANVQHALARKFPACATS